MGPIPVIDAAQFDQLLAMAGPRVAKDLLSQLRADLVTARHTLLAATDPADWAGMRAQTHVLLGLAGTVGAQDLYHLARALNDFAQTPAPDAQMAIVLASQTAMAIDAVLAVLSHAPSVRQALA